MSIERLARELMRGDLAARRRAAEALALRGTAAAAAAVTLVRAAADEDDETAEWAIAALEDLGPPLDPALPQIAELLTHTPADAAYWAATLIGRAESAAANCVHQLSEALQTRRETAVRERIVWALGRIGPSASSASAAIESAARAANCPPRLARLCREALQSIRPPPPGPPATGTNTFP